MNNTLRFSVLLVALVLFLPFLQAEEKKADPVETAIKNLDSKDWYVCGQAMLFLRDQKNHDALKKAVPKYLDAKEPFTAMIACTLAGELALSDQIAKLGEICINSKYRGVSDAAAWALAKLNEAEGLRALRNSWGEKPEPKARNFARALIFFKSSKPKDEILTILKGNYEDNTKCYALEAATAFATPDKEIDKAISTIKTKSEVLDYHIIEYMPNFVDKRAADKHLKKMVKERSTNIAMRAGASLSMLEDFNPASLVAVAGKKTSVAPSNAALRAIGDSQYYVDDKVFAKLLTGKTAADKISACALIEAFQLNEMAGSLVKIIKGKEEYHARLAAMRALCALELDEKDKNSVDEVITALLTSTKEDDLLIGLLGAAYKADKKYIDAAGKAIEGAISKKVSAMAGFALNAISPEDGIKICETMIKTNVLKKATSALRALANLPYKESVELLFTCLDIKQKDLRKETLFYLNVLTGCNFTADRAVWEKWWKTQTENIERYTPPKEEDKKGEAEKDGKKIRQDIRRLWKSTKTSLHGAVKERPEVLKQLGLNTKSEQVVETALAWLANFQDTDGKWNSANFKIHAVNPKSVTSGPGEAWDEANTALALLSFFEAGYKPNDPMYGRIMHRGLDYLNNCVCVDGSLTKKPVAGAQEGEIFEHALVLEAFVEAYLAGETQYRVTVQRMLDFLALNQSIKGGWGWTPNVDKNVCTPSTTYCAQAFVKARAAGFEIMPGLIEGIWEWFYNVVSDPVEQFQLEMTEKMTQEEYDKKITAKSSSGWEDMEFFASNTAMAAYALRLVGIHRNNPHVISKLNLLTDYKAADWTTAGSVARAYNHHYHLFLTRAKFIRNGKEFKGWFTELTTFLDDKMEKEEDAKGSWIPKGWDGKMGGRILATSLSAIALMTPYSPSTKQYKPAITALK